MLQINLYYTLFLLLSTMCYSLTSGAWIALKSNEDPWKQGKCREKSDGGKTFYVPNVGHIECSLNSCPLTGRAVYGIDYCCFTCCWANITAEALKKQNSTEEIQIVLNTTREVLPTWVYIVFGLLGLLIVTLIVTLVIVCKKRDSSSTEIQHDSVGSIRTVDNENIEINEM